MFEELRTVEVEHKLWVKIELLQRAEGARVIKDVIYKSDAYIDDIMVDPAHDISGCSCTV